MYSEEQYECREKHWYVLLLWPVHVCTILKQTTTTKKEANNEVVSGFILADAHIFRVFRICGPDIQRSTDRPRDGQRNQIPRFVVLAVNAYHIHTTTETDNDYNVERHYKSRILEFMLFWSADWQLQPNESSQCRAKWMKSVNRTTTKYK